MNINHSCERRRTRTEDWRRHKRLVSERVIENYRSFASTIGMSQAIDYSRILDSNQGALYASHRGFPTIDYVADVESAVKAKLTGHALWWYMRLLKNAAEPNHTHLTDEQLDTHSLMGGVYLSRSIHPLTRYLAPCNSSFNS